MADGPFVTRLIPLLAGLEDQAEAFGQRIEHDGRAPL